MPTEINGYSPSEETALSSLIINEVDSTETFEKMKEKGLLQDNQLYLVTDEQASAGIDEVPTEGSKNLVYSGGVYQAIQEAGGGDGGRADSIIEQNKGLEQKFWRGTKEEFNAVETKSDDTMYIITDEEGTATTGGSEIYVGAEAPEDADFWIDTDGEESGEYYTKAETDALIDGITAEDVGAAPSVVVVESETVSVAAENLQAYLDALPRLITKALTIAVTGTVSDTHIYLQHFYGPGNIVISGGTYQRIYIYNCYLDIQIINATFIAIAEQLQNPDFMVDVVDSLYVQCHTCTFDGNNFEGYAALRARNSRALFEQCTCENLLHVIHGDQSGHIAVRQGTYNNNQQGIYCYHGGIVTLGHGLSDNLNSLNPSVVHGGLIVSENGNPVRYPYLVDQEQPTGEWYGENPVYIKFVDFGNLPNNDVRYKNPNITGFVQLIEPPIVKIQTSDGSIHSTPMMDDGKCIARSWFKMASGGIAIKTYEDRSTDTAIVELKYTKSVN